MGDRSPARVHRALPMGLGDVYKAGGQRGFVTATDVSDAEVRVEAFRRHAKRLGWSHQRRGSWVPPGVTLTHQQRTHEAVSGLSNVLITGRTALLLYGIVDDKAGSVELLAPAREHYTTQDDVCLHRTRVFDAVGYQHRVDLQVVMPARAYADDAVHSTVNDLCRDIAVGLRQRQCTLALIGGEVLARKRFPGRGKLRQAHALLSEELPHSSDERLGRRLLRDAGARPHHQPLTIESDGRLIAEIDIPFASCLYGVEVDGPHHLLPDVAAADRIRDRELDELGWTIDRFFWFELEERPEWFVAQVMRRLAEAEQRARG